MEAAMIDGTRLLSITVAGAILACSTAHAAQDHTGPYILVQTGQVHFDTGVDGLFQTHRRSLGGLIGWQATPFLGIEAGYLDVQRSSLHLSTPTPTGTLNFDAYTKVRGWLGTVVGTYPLGQRWSLFARAGAWRSKNSASALQNGVLVVSDSGHLTHFLYAGGIGYTVGPGRLRAEYGRFSDFPATKVSNLSLSYQWFLPFANR
jgi:hypothetical protein